MDIIYLDFDFLKLGKHGFIKIIVSGLKFLIR